MADKIDEAMDSSTMETPSPEKADGRSALLDSGDDFEVLDEDDIGDEPPPLEDTGGGKQGKADDSVDISSDADSESQPQLEKWLDVLGTSRTPGP